MTKTILVVTDNTLDQINGVVTTFKNIEKVANSDGYRIVYIDPGQFHHINAPCYPEVKLSWPWGIGRKIKEINPDHIHIATEGPLGVAASNYCWRNGIRYNTSYHTKFPDFMKKIYGIPEWMTYWFVRWFHKHSGKVLTTTQTMVNDLRAHGFKGEIIPWTRGVDRTVFKSELRTFVDVPKPILLNVGRVSKEKGLDDFCNLDYPGTKIIVGDGPYLKELKERYPDIYFAGAKRGEELAFYFSIADVFVFPSRTDTFGVVIIESMACGTPVAAYPVPGPIDIIEQGVTGWMSEDLKESVDHCLDLDRGWVEEVSKSWTWENCWTIFRDNLVPKK